MCELEMICKKNTVRGFDNWHGVQTEKSQKGHRKGTKICVSKNKVVKSPIKSNQTDFCAASDTVRKRLKILVSLVRFQLIPQKQKRSFSLEKGLFCYY